MGLSQEQLVELARDYQAGLPLTEIAAKFDIDTSSVTRIRKRLDLPARRNRTVFRLAADEDIAAAREALRG